MIWLQSKTIPYSMLMKSKEKALPDNKCKVTNTHYNEAKTIEKLF